MSAPEDLTIEKITSSLPELAGLFPDDLEAKYAVNRALSSAARALLIQADAGQPMGLQLLEASQRLQKLANLLPQKPLPSLAHLAASPHDAPDRF